MQRRSSVCVRPRVRSKLSALYHVVLLLLLVVLSAFGQSEEMSKDLFDNFRPGWKQDWMVRTLASRPTRYDVVTERGDAALRATSDASASALWRRLDLERPTVLMLSWRWKIERSLTGNDRERTKEGDDYAARLLVAFGPDVFSRSTRALCYVWAEGESVGSMFRSPYSANVATIVLESGNGKSGLWIREQRDVLEDYRGVFGEPAVVLAAIAVIVDTDDTESTAVAWFDDVRIQYRP